MKPQARRWAEALRAWAIPDEILAAAPESPWGFPTGVFSAAAVASVGEPLTPTHQRAIEVLPDGGTVLDVGAGAGAASLPLSTRAALLIAVDASADMLDELRALASGRVEVETVEGRWPDVAVCAHVAYNVADIDEFVAALSRHARHRVVLEVTAVHPQSNLTPMWQHFWQLERPTTPTAADAIAVIEETLDDVVSSVRWSRRHPTSGRSAKETVAWVRRRLCLPATADEEIEALLGPDPQLAPTDVVTVWWSC